MTAPGPLSPELTVTVGTGWTYIGNGEALRLRAITGGCAVIEIARADLAFPAPPADDSYPDRGAADNAL